MKTLCCDVGSSSVRVAIIEYGHGNVLKTKPLAVVTSPLTIYNKTKDFYEQSTKEIWSAFCKCVSQCLQQTDLSSVNSLKSFPIDAIAFSATCSLVIVEEKCSDNELDVIMWMDHRAKNEAQIFNESKHEVLNQFGGTCSPEFSLAKLFWLYRNDRTRFDSAKAFMELSDWLTYRCSQYFGFPQAFPRSLCCVTCKWGYDSQNSKWRDDLFNQIGMTWNQSLEDKIGRLVVIPGVRVSTLNVAAAKEIGFIFVDEPTTKTIDSVSLASSLIDAHSGFISMLIFGNQLTGNDCSNDLYENVFCMISGTSTCHMVLNKNRTFTKGVWGPYLDAVIPGYHLREAGQSATGKLIEHVIKSYFHENLPLEMSQIICDLNHQLKLKNFDHRTSMIVNPTFHGNRSPIADPHLKGAIYGFTLENTSLLDLYVATMEAIAYETRFIVEEIEKNSDNIRNVIVTGGLTKNEFYLQLHADILGVELFTFSAGDADLMLVGASVIAFTASQIDQKGNRQQLVALLKEIKLDTDGFNEQVRIFKPRKSSRDYHQIKYECYRRLLNCSIEIETILSKQL